MKSIKYFVFASLFCLCACSDDNNDQKNLADLLELKVDMEEVSIAQGDTRTVNITSGNGEYVVTSANEDVVIAEVEGEKLKLTAVKGKNNAEGIVYLCDKYYQRVKIRVYTAAEFDLKLNQTLFTLYSQIEGADEAVIQIYTGNGGYSLEVNDENNCIEILDEAQLEETEKVTVKGVRQGSAEIKVIDSKGKMAFVTLNVIAPKPILTDADETGILIEEYQATEQVKILSGNGGYKILNAGDPRVVRLEIYGNVVTVIGNGTGETSFTIVDDKNQVSKPIHVRVLFKGESVMNLGNQYALWADFNEMGGTGAEALRTATNNFKLKKMTWEVIGRIDANGWLQTFIGKENYLMLRGGDWEGNRGSQMELVGNEDTDTRLKLRTGHGAFKVGEWTHIALVVDCEAPFQPGNWENRFKLYVNGVYRPWSDYAVIDLKMSEIDLCAEGADGTRIAIGKARDGRPICSAFREARIWSICRTEAQLKANAWNLEEENPEGLLARWLSPYTSLGRLEDATNSDHQLPLHICTVNSWDEVMFPGERLEAYQKAKAPIMVPFK